MTIQVAIGATSQYQFSIAEQRIRSHPVRLDVKHVTPLQYKESPLLWRDGRTLYIDASVELCTQIEDVFDIPNNNTIHVLEDNGVPLVVLFDDHTSTQEIPMQLDIKTTNIQTHNTDGIIEREADPTSMSWCYQHRHELTSSDDGSQYVRHQAMTNAGFTARPERVLGIDKNTLAYVLIPRTVTEFRISDITIPYTYSTPYKPFPQSTWKVVVWSYDPYKNPITHQYLHARVIQTLYGDKEAPYMPRAYGYDVVEIGWVAYDEVGGSIFIHHVQMPGILRGTLPDREQRWMYRALIRGFCYAQSNKSIYMVEASSYSTASELATGQRIPMVQFSKHVAKGCGFTLRPWTDIVASHPPDIATCSIPSYIDPHQLHFWKYTNEDGIDSQSV